MTDSTDPRPQLGSALDQTQRQITALRAEDLDRSTPCAEYDVRTLVAHIVAVLRKLAAVGWGADMSAVTDPADDIGDGRLVEEFSRARADLEHAFLDYATLDKDHTLPWGTMTGRALIDAYSHEFTVHAWDLARATGRLADLDPALAEAALDWFARNEPPDSRSQDGPFAPVVEVGDQADLYTRLAGYAGRAVQP